MTREEAKELLPIIQAFAEGKTIEFMLTDGDWQVANSPTWRSGLTYRIKPEPKYRPFKNNAECWEEMQKHQPFGWLINKKTRCYVYPVLYTSITAIFADKNSANFNTMFKEYTFADDTPFGIKDE